MQRRILDAAKQLFVKQGFDNVSMRRIAAAIEYSPAALYRYFKNKREILSMLRDEGFKRFIDGRQSRLQAIEDPLERLRTGVRGYLDFALNEPDYYYLMFSTSCKEVDFEGAQACNSIRSYNLFYSHVEACVRKGVFGEASVETVAFAIWSGLIGLAHLLNSGRVALLGKSDDLDALIESVLSFNLRPGNYQNNIS